MKNTILTFTAIIFTVVAIGSLISVNSSTLSNYLNFTSAKAASYSVGSGTTQRVWRTSADVATLTASTNNFMLSDCHEGDVFVRQNLAKDIDAYSDEHVMQVIKDSKKLCQP
jgi:hypothetical protein